MRLSLPFGFRTEREWTRLVRLLMTLVALAILQGCATDLYRNGRVAKAQSTDFTVEDLRANTKDQNEILALLQQRAGVGDPTANPTDWDKVIAAGLEYADYRCENYMGALVRLNRDKKTITSEIGLVGTATAGVMAAAKSAARDIALAAIAFGLASSTVDNLGGNVLYEIEPSSVRVLVKSLQVKYRTALTSGYTSRPAAMNVIRAYTALCTPANIEAELNHAVKNAQPTAAAGDITTGRAPDVTNADPGASRYAPDAVSAILDDFIRVNGQIAQVPTSKLLAAMQQIGVTGISVLKFINGADYARERPAALKILLANK